MSDLRSRAHPAHICAGDCLGSPLALLRIAHEASSRARGIGGSVAGREDLLLDKAGVFIGTAAVNHALHVVMDTVINYMHSEYHKENGV